MFALNGTIEGEI